MSTDSPREPDSSPLFTRAFVFANAVFFLALSNQAVFYNFTDHLVGFGIDPETVGMLLGVFNLVPISVRPFITPYFNRHNAVRWLTIAAAGVVCCMASYAFVTQVAGLYVLRVLHGLFFVLLLTSLMAVIVDVIPEGKSGQAYSILTLANLVPYAVIPPVCERLLSAGLRQSVVYLLSAGFMLLIFPLLWSIDRRGNPAGRQPERTAIRLTRAELWANFKGLPILVVFVLTIIAYTGSTMTFYFLKNFARTIGVEDVGMFFTTYIVMMILVRLFSSRFLDRVNKGWVACGTLLFLAATFLAFGQANRSWHLFACAVAIGLGWGLLMPILGALIFDLSAPRLRTYNTNMMLEMIDAGYIIGPAAGGLVIAASGFPAMFTFAAAASLAGAMLTPVLIKRSKGHG